MGRPIIDSHVHLWPESMSNEAGHRWMTPGMSLAKPHLLSDYNNATTISEPKRTVDGFIFIETDARQETPATDLAAWTVGPLDEIGFLREIVKTSNGRRMIGVVLWAPILQPTSVLEEWLCLAEGTAGPDLWNRVRGFRFLLQHMIAEADFRTAVTKPEFIDNLRLLGERRHTFDVGVDQRKGGICQLDLICRAIEQTHEGVAEDQKTIFILNHLCKPDLSRTQASFDEWCSSIVRLSRCSKTYMKLSGAFSELPEGSWQVEDITKHIQPWFEHILKCFGASRIMFGSDWPVCNINGPNSVDSWSSWKEVVLRLLEDNQVPDEDRTRIWRGTAAEAYSI